MSQEERERIARQRGKLVMELVAGGESFADIGRIFGISGERARQIFDAAKARSESEVRSLGLKTQTYNALEAALGRDPLTLIDIQRFIEGNSDWREKLLGKRHLGPKTVHEIEEFARQNGIRT